MAKKRRRKKKIRVKKLLFLMMIILLEVYLGIACYFRFHFFPHTRVNGMEYSLKSAAKLRKHNQSNGKDYKLKLTDGEGNSYELDGSEFSYEYEDKGKEEKLTKSQHYFRWPAELGKKHEYTVKVSGTYDEDALEACVRALEFMNRTEYTAAQNAELTLSDKGIYEIKKEVYGNEPEREKVIAKVKAAVDEGLTELTLSNDCYIAPKITSEDKKLVQAMKKIKTYFQSSVTYEINGANEVVDEAKISMMLKVGEDGSVTLDPDKVASYVQGLASKYNTYGDKRSFQTSQGDTVEIGGGDYGWVISRSRETERLTKDLESGKAIKREPVYEQTAKVSGANDIGNTYIEIDYTNQHLYYYKDGKKVMDSEVVTGNISNGNGSPDGIFKVVYKQSPATLVGENYESKVKYFMVFAYNVGIHDASWRTNFGGEIYKTAGSHGCINVPGAFAKKLYKVLEDGTPVVAYYRHKVKLTSESNQKSNAFSYAKE